MHYTSARGPDLGLGVVREARPLDAGWDRWEKRDVVVRPPEDRDLVVFRDPVVLPDGAGWRMLVGAGDSASRPAVLGYTSDDLRSWRFDGEVAAGSADAVGDGWTGDAWECPQLLAVDGRAVLVVSVWAGGTTHHVAASVGTRVDGRFTPGRWTRLTTDDGPYAASASCDAEGRPCLTFWLRGVADPAGTWTGALSTTYRVAVVDDELRLSPHPQVLARLGPHEHVLARPGARGVPARLRAAAGETLGEVRADGGEVVLEVLGRVVRLPSRPGPVHVLLDDVVLEVCAPGGLAGCAVPRGTRSQPGDG